MEVSFSLFGLGDDPDAWNVRLSDYGGEVQMQIRHDYCSSNMTVINRSGLVDLFRKEGWLPAPIPPARSSTPDAKDEDLT